jgi:hypothetical protein
LSSNSRILQVRGKFVAQIAKEAILYRKVLRVPAGSVTLHFVVRDNLNGRTGSVVLNELYPGPIHQVGPILTL